MSLRMLLLLMAFTTRAVAAPIDFDKDVRPILAQNCISCHGLEKQKGGLRLDVANLALDGGDSGKAILPGQGERSLLVQRLRGQGGDDQMPLKKPPLPPEQIALISRWIDQGAAWPKTTGAAPKHWSFIAPKRPIVPAVKDAAWPRNDIDRFVLSHLEKQGLHPAPEAPGETLLRRVSLDLTGLPPTLAELDEFLADTTPDAYEKRVDRLLASPHFGERWARHWLDGARYADSNGYSIDAPRSIWPYRDWVINALNRDMPFDEFTIEQLAGDLLPNATTDQKIATGFHRNTQINEEGGIDKEQFRVESIIDRVGTTGTVFLGLTVACAQCHNHKFDPISQREFYQLFSFFNECDEPRLNLPHNVTTLIVRERKEPRPNWIFIKGDFTRHGDPVTPGVPAILPPLKVEHPTRLDLAKWIVDPGNPLTARVQVNRFWMHLFGKGIVETDNDFGTQGSPPSDQALLDYLATEFMAKHWSTKAILREIVTSATYRQSSARPTQDSELSTQNFSSQSRIRLDSEIVRDTALVASGLFCDKIGGPPVYPPQPDGVLSLGQIKRAWKTSPAPDCYRRGIYTFIWRMTPHPLLNTFDTPDATLACTRRNRSNNPLQALILLNDSGFVEFARALAGRTLGEAPSDDPSRIAHAFRLCTSRRPTPAESQVLLRLLQEQRKAMADSPDAAKLAASIHRPQAIQKSEFAAWVVVSRVILCLDETITRE